MNKENRTIQAILLMVILVICFGMICLINFSGVPSFYDADMYCDYQYAMEVWEEKSIFPDGWVFGNQLNAVSTPVLAALIYGLTGNMNFSMGAASTIMAALLIYCYDWMLKAVLQDLESRRMAIVLLLTSVLYGGTAASGRDGWTLLFTMCSYYAGYSITAFLAFGCYLRGLSGSFRQRGAVLVLTCILSFGTGIQSIRQTAIMVAPILAVEFLRMLVFHKKWKEHRAPLWIALCIAISNIGGLCYIRLLPIRQNQIFGAITLTPLTDLIQAVKDCLLYILILIGSENPGNSIVLWGSCILCAVGILLILWNLKREMSTGVVAVVLLMGLSFLIIMVIDIFTTIVTWPRYYFMIYPLMGFLLAYGYARMGDRFRLGLMAILLAFFGVSAIHEFPEVCLSAAHRNEEVSYEISDYLLENGYTTIYALWEQADDVAIASNGEIRVGYWHEPETTFQKMPYLCNVDIYNASPDQCVYFFQGRQYADIGIAKAESVGVSLQLIRQYPESDIYLYTAPINLMQHFR